MVMQEASMIMMLNTLKY